MYNFVFRCFSSFLMRQGIGKYLFHLEHKMKWIMVYSHDNFNMKVLRFNRTRVIAQSAEFFLILFSLFSNFREVFHFWGETLPLLLKTFPKSAKNPKLFRNQNSGIMSKYSPLIQSWTWNCPRRVTSSVIAQVGL